MSRLEKALQTLKLRKEKAFVPYIMAGDGGLDLLKERLMFLESCGATAVEIGIPFSDPVADGPTIQEAGVRALKNGTTLREILIVIKGIRPFVSIPLVLMSYLNPIYAYGVAAFIKDARKAGIDGLIIPDLPMEEEELISSYLDDSSIELIRLVTITSSKERIREISSQGRGFLYAVTVTGTTGVRGSFPDKVGEYLKGILEISPIPVLAGFGISTPKQVEEMGRYCHGVVVGSKIVELFHKENLGEISSLIQASKNVKI